jgi:hypothetical protein
MFQNVHEIDIFVCCKNAKNPVMSNLMQPSGGSRLLTETRLASSLLVKLRNFIQMSKLIAFNQKKEA